MPRSGVDRLEQRKLTRARLVDAALQLFSSSGYEHATVDDIARAAGYSKGAYYFHFSTKEDILLELLRMWTDGRGAALAAVEEPITADGLRETLEAFFSYAESPRWPAVLLEFWAQAVRDDQMKARLAQAYSGWRRRLATAFSAAAASGLHVDNAEEAAAMVLAAHDGFAVQLAIGSPGGQTMSPAQLADSIVAPLETPAVAPERRTVAM